MARLNLANLVFLFLITAAVFPPFVPLVGPLSLDDVLPILALLVAIAILPFRRGRLPVDVTIIGFSLLALAAIISSAANADSIADFFRLAGRSAGRALFYQLLIVGTRSLLDNELWPRRALIFIAVAATLEAVFCIWAYQTSYSGPFGMGVIGFADWSVLAGKTRVQGTFSGAYGRYEVAAVSPNFLAAYLIMSVPVTLALVLTTKRGLARALALSAMSLQIVALYLTYTRAALLALAVGVLAIGFLLGKKKVAFAALALGLLVSLSVPSVRTKFKESHDRWGLFWASKEIMLDHAATGVGDGNYDRVLHENQRYHDTPYGIATTTSHNSVLLSAAVHGMPGGAAHLLLYMMVVVVVVRAVRRADSRDARLVTAALGGAVFAFLAQDQLNNLAYVPKVATQLWFIVGLLPLASRSSLISARAESLPEPSSMAPTRSVVGAGPDFPHSYRAQ